MNLFAWLSSYRTAISIAGALAFSVTANAALTSCAGSPISTISAAAGNNPANGCGQVDIGFNSFTTSGGVNANAITVAGSGGTVTPGTPATITGILETFASPNWAIASGTNALTRTITNSAHAYGSAVTGLTAASYPTAPYAYWGITGLRLSANVAERRE